MADPVFTIYTMGDVAVFKAALTGVAMIFSPGSGAGFVGAGGAGLGTLAVFGLLISLTLMLFQGVLKQKLEIGEMVVLVIVFSVMFVPKFGVQIEDYYDSGQIGKVDGVPLGVALPAAAMSTITKEINNKLATAYQTVEGSYYPNVVTPLKLLNSFRTSAKAFDSVAPMVSANVKSYTLYCLAGRDEFDIHALRKLKIGDPTGFVSTFTGIPTEPGGFVPYYSLTSPVGTLVTCDDMKSKLAMDLNKFFDPNNDFETLLNSTTYQAQIKGVSGVPTVTRFKTDDYTQAFVAVANATSQEAANFAYYMFFTPQINGASYCANNLANQTEMAKCMAFATATQQWAEDSAAAGTFFQRLMKHGQNMLLFMFFCLSPVVAMVMLMMGMRGLKIGGAYMLFGAWSQSWFVGATIVNFYIQTQILQELQMNGGVGNLDMNTYPGFLDSMTLKLGIAGDMMASVPLIMMAILSGSVYGMTAVAQRWGGKDHYNENINTPPLMLPAAMSQMSAAHTGVMGRNSLESNAFMDAGTIGASSQLVNQMGNQQQSVQKDAVAVQQQFSQDLSAAVQHGVSGTMGRDLSTSLKASGQDASARTVDLLNSVANDTGHSASERAQASAALKAYAKAGFALGGTGAGLEASTAIDRATAELTDKSEKESLQEAKRNSQSYSANMTQEGTAGTIARFTKEAQKTESFRNSTALSKTQSHADEFQKSQSNLQQLQAAQAFSQSTSFATVGRVLADDNSHQMREGLTRIAESRTNAGDQKFVEAYTAARNNLANSTVRNYDAAVVNNLATLRALAATDVQEFSKQVGLINGSGMLETPNSPVAQTRADTGTAATLRGSGVTSSGVFNTAGGILGGAERTTGLDNSTTVLSDIYNNAANQVRVSPGAAPDNKPVAPTKESPGMVPQGLKDKLASKEPGARLPDDFQNM